MKNTLSIKKALGTIFILNCLLKGSDGVLHATGTGHVAQRNSNPDETHEVPGTTRDIRQVEPSSESLSAVKRISRNLNLGTSSDLDGPSPSEVQTVTNSLLEPSGETQPQAQTQSNVLAVSTINNESRSPSSTTSKPLSTSTLASIPEEHVPQVETQDSLVTPLDCLRKSLPCSAKSGLEAFCFLDCLTKNDSLLSNKIFILDQTITSLCETIGAGTPNSRSLSRSKKYPNLFNNFKFYLHMTSPGGLSSSFVHRGAKALPSLIISNAGTKWTALRFLLQDIVRGIGTRTHGLDDEARHGICVRSRSEFMGASNQLVSLLKQNPGLMDVFLQGYMLISTVAHGIPRADPFGGWRALDLGIQAVLGNVGGCGLVEFAEGGMVEGGLGKDHFLVRTGPGARPPHPCVPRKIFKTILVYKNGTRV